MQQYEIRSWKIKKANKVRMLALKSQYEETPFLHRLVGVMSVDMLQKLRYPSKVDLWGDILEVCSGYGISPKEIRGIPYAVPIMADLVECIVFASSFLNEDGMTQLHLFPIGTVLDYDPTTNRVVWEIDTEYEPETLKGFSKSNNKEDFCVFIGDDDKIYKSTLFIKNNSLCVFAFPFSALSVVCYNINNGDRSVLTPDCVGDYEPLRLSVATVEAIGGDEYYDG